MAKVGATVVMVCRDRSRGEAARAEIKAESGNDSLDLMIADLSSQQSIRGMVEGFKAKYDRLDVLINNAAIFKMERAVTPDGLEAMFATNHLGPFLMTNLLLDVLKASAPARILNVTAPSTIKLDFDDLQGEKRFRPFEAFGASNWCAFFLLPVSPP